MTKVRMHKWLAAGAVVATAFGIGLIQKPASAEKPSTKEAKERCALRVSIALKGVSDATLLGAADPQAAVDTMLTAPEFVERFSTFINSEFNLSPGMKASEDAPYYMMKYVLENNLAYKDMFQGKYTILPPQNNAAPAVTPDDNGLGYFRARDWMVRYAGNETEGIRIVTAYRVMQNITGLRLQAVQDTSGVDASKAGRTSNPACKGCHGDGTTPGPAWYNLDKVAGIFPKRNGTGNNMKFDGPKPLPDGVDIGGKVVTDDASLVDALVNSEDFSFNACRLVFRYLYGRSENTCEAQVFEKCRTAFKASGKIQAGVAAVAKDESFCQ